MPSRDSSTATRWSSRDGPAPATLSSEPTLPARTRARSASSTLELTDFCRPPGSWISWPSFSSSVIRASRASTRAEATGLDAWGWAAMADAARQAAIDSVAISPRTMSPTPLYSSGFGDPRSVGPGGIVEQELGRDLAVILIPLHPPSQPEPAMRGRGQHRLAEGAVGHAEGDRLDP